MAKRRPFESDAPADGPPGNQDPPALPPHLGHFGRNITGNFRGNLASRRQSNRVQDVLREHA